ncbi:HNH endonuclease [Zhongshania aquimaris]|uniref:HNH endonuclease n=1 Tax=Zhongshania aquimaris TaxID=2857107 RepID=A0ABS6VSC0_9GAMM|nr:HNH endonuclease [Zhongshania aquimaris]MBW2941212.1 HNH endonuclease [Zhongshania aquimaris]
MAVNLWTKEQLKLAFYLYCQLPFGKLHRGTNDIVELAEMIGRTPSAVSLKLVNLASLDPAIRNSGRSGMMNVSKLDREIWDEFHADWEGLLDECSQLIAKWREGKVGSGDVAGAEAVSDFQGEMRSVLTEQRIGQRFFRRSVLAAYKSRCCISGLDVPQLLVASHIVPWSEDKLNRLNPGNGLCLSALYDRAFDQGFITVDENWRLLVSGELKQRSSAVVQASFIAIEGQAIEMPERFMPTSAFMEWHRDNVYLT